MRDLGGAQRELEQARQLYEQYGNQHGQQRVLGNLADLALQLGDADRAVALAEQRRAIVWSSDDSPHEMADCLSLLARVYLAVGEEHEAEQCLLQAEKVLEPLQLRWPRLKLLARRAVRALLAHDARQFLELIEQAEVLADTVEGSAADLPGILRAQSRELIKIGRVDLAERVLTRAASYARRRNDRRELADTLGDLAGAMKMQARLVDARSILQQQQQIVAADGEPIQLQKVLGNEAVLLWEMAMHSRQPALLDRADELAAKAEGISRESGNLDGEGFQLCTRGLVARMQNRWDAAIEFLARSVEVLRRSGHLDTLVRSLLNLTALCLELESVDEAQPLLIELAMIPRTAKGAAELRQEQMLRAMLRAETS